MDPEITTLLFEEDCDVGMLISALAQSGTDVLDAAVDPMTSSAKLIATHREFFADNPDLVKKIGLYMLHAARQRNHPADQPDYSNERNSS